VRDREGEDGEAQGDVLLDPRGELRVGAGVAGDDLFESALCGGEIRAEEDAAHGFGDSGPLVEAGDVGLGVLLEMELAALPRDGGKPVVHSFHSTEEWSRSQGERIALRGHSSVPELLFARKVFP